MSKIEAVIFDWDGTTVDYGSFASVRAFQEVFRYYGIDLIAEEVREPMGMSKIDHIRAVLQGNRIAGIWEEKYGEPWNETDVKVMYDLFEEKLLAILDQYAKPKPYVLEIVGQLRRNRVKIGSTTGYSDKMMTVLADAAAKAGYQPDCWFSPDSVAGCGRPYPYMIYKNMMTLGIGDVRKVCKIGDTISDIVEGIQAGVRTIGVVEGSSELGMTEEEYAACENKEAQIRKVTRRYMDAGADYVIRNLSELPAYL